MFKIRGADGKEYGPVTVDQLRQWIREGRAGAQTQVQPVETTTWSPLGQLPAFAELFATPPPLPNSGTPGSLPPVVRMIAFAFFIVAAISGLWLLMNLFTMLPHFRNGNFAPGLIYFFGWGVGILSLPVRVLCGIGLLRGREWARRLAVACGTILALYGVWALVRTVIMFANISDPLIILRSPMFLVSNLWSLVLLVFNIASAIILCRPDVCVAFSRKALPTL